MAAARVSPVRDRSGAKPSPIGRDLHNSSPYLLIYSFFASVTSAI